MSPKQLKILKNLFFLSKKEREEIIQIFEQPSIATSSNGLIPGNKMTVAYFINDLKNDSNFQAVVKKIHQASELGIASE